ncbi:MAG: aminoacyl-tRNA hydrolase [Erysipelotrichaceae bacterium]|nr:aminoacyl-tRNA hydrolase [Erysipelotrichaceae bacterium]
MKLIVGLGNPGEKYENTRHNTGFLTMDIISRQLGIPVTRRAFEALIGKGAVNGEPVVLMKPQTYMNESGRSVGKAAAYYKLDKEKDILIIYDDLDLPVGSIRLRSTGSDGGHNGLKSIIAHLRTRNFNRIRIGIDKNPRIQTIDYVLGKVRREDRPAYQDALERAAEAAVKFIDTPFDRVMNIYNVKEKNG